LLFVIQDKGKHTTKLINKIKTIDLPKMEIIKNSPIPTYIVRGNTEKIVRIDILFPAGRKYEVKKAVARSCNALLREGTQAFTSEEIASKLDFYGFYLKTENDLDYAGVSLISLAKYFPIGLKILMDIVQYPAYRDEEVAKYTATSAQKMKLELNKNDVISFRSFTETLYGSSHKYGYNTIPEDFLQISPEDLRSFHKEHYQLSKAKIILSGHVDDKIQAELLEALKEVVQEKNLQDLIYQKPDFTNEYQKLSIASANEFQSSIRIGKLLFPMNHKDYIDFFILNTVLGGFFGSRLMKNIRESKGLSYNIYSSLEAMEEDGYFYIQTEVKKGTEEQTIAEIYKEMEILSTQSIPQEELEMIRNYMLGNIMHMFDGPFSSANVIKNLLKNGQSIEFFRSLIDRIGTITDSDLLTLSHDYLTRNTMLELIVN
jgi:predicted Zn-dependent peptidase